MKAITPAYRRLIFLIGGIILVIVVSYSNFSPFFKPLKGKHEAGQKKALHEATPVVRKSRIKVYLADTASHTIPLRRIGRLFVMEAEVDGEQGNLIFDTGATGLVLNRTYFRDHVSSGEINSSGITGSAGNVAQVTADKVIVSSLQFKSIPAHLSDLGHIENKRGIKVLGLFGFELIKKYQVEIDVANNLLKLDPADTKGNLLNPLRSCSLENAQKIEFSNNVLFIKASVGGKLLRFCFDTGAETNALSSDLPGSVLKTVAITRTYKLRGAGAASSEVLYGNMNNFLLGDSAMQNMETIITYLGHLNEAYGVQTDGVLGFDFISRATFCINFAKKQMGITYLSQSRQ